MTELTLTVAGKRALTDRIAEFTLTPAAGPMPGWDPGAHIRVALPDGGDRAYSLVSFAPVPAAPDHYRIAVLLEENSTGGSAHMHALAEGDSVTIAPPKCDFPVNAGAPALLLAGGIGITPMISMAAALKAAGTPFRLHFAARSAAAMAYADDLGLLCGEALTLHFDDIAGGPVDVTALVRTLGADTHFYICGPRPMIDAARAAAEAAGIPPGRVHVELFDNAAATEGDTAFEVELASTGEVFTIPPGRSIIDVLEEAGHDLMYDCQRGDCGICQTDVLDGTPDHRDVVLTEAERAAGKVMQICVSRAKSARLKLDL